MKPDKKKKREKRLRKLSNIRKNTAPPPVSLLAHLPKSKPNRGKMVVRRLSAEETADWGTAAEVAAGTKRRVRAVVA